MDRIIEVKVVGNHLIKDNKNAGVRGEANVTRLRITFDESWDSYAKKVTFWDARGLNPVELTLTTDLLEDITKSTLIYLVPIPAEPLAEAGSLTFVIDGYSDGKRQRSLSDKLSVKDAPMADNAGEPTDITPTQAEQLQGEIENIKNEIQDVYAAKADAATNASAASYSAGLSGDYAEKSQQYATDASASAHFALEAVAKAEATITRYPMITEGYWYVWDAQFQEYINTGIRAQAGSTVYMGDKPPAEADVWINPDGDPDNYATVAFVEARLLELANKVAPSPASVTLYADRWKQSENEQRWHQEVEVANATITEYSKIDLQLSAEQIMIFYEKDLAFVTENDGGNVTVYCIGRVPENDYVIQATVSEVVING